MAKTIALLNMKGGVGKTTLAVNLAWHLCRRKDKRVLLVDLDPQFNASQYTMSYKEWSAQKQKGTIADLILSPTKSTMPVKPKKASKASKKGQYDDLIFEREVTAGGGCLHVIPSELNLAMAIKNPHGVEYKLEKACSELAVKYDFIVIDCAPTDSILTDAAFMASDYVLVPIRPDRFSVLGFGHMRAALATFRETYPDPHNVQDLGVVFTQVLGEHNQIQTDCMADVSAQADYVFDVTVPNSKSYLTSVHQQTPVFDTPYCRKLTKDCIEKLSAEMNQRIESLEKLKAGV